ncbi:MAG: hypothetical protein M3Y59_18235 [Myxococcota bacterium]|nr:hypothetical protein [Myxococcota bacterium]
MRRLWILLFGLMAPAASALAQEAAAPSEGVGTASLQIEEEQDAKPLMVPVYLPRAAFLGAYVNDGALTPQLRLQWQHTLIQKNRDAFVAYLEGGGGFGLSLPNNLLPYANGRMTSLYQHVALIGLGYNAVYSDGWAWGFQVLTGAQWYGGNFTDPLVPDERRLGGTVEGRANLGLNIGPVRLMASAGWGQLWVVPRSSVSARFVGGPIFGVYVDWRPIVSGR